MDDSYSNHPPGSLNAQMPSYLHTHVIHDDLSTSPAYLSQIGSPQYYPQRKRGNQSPTLQVHSKRPCKISSRLGFVGKPPISPQNMDRQRKGSNDNSGRQHYNPNGDQSISPITEVQIRVREDRVKIQKFRDSLEAKNMQLFRCSQMSY